MIGYHIHEGMFEIDDGWTDGSMNMLSRPLPGGQQASLVITREPREGDTLDAHVDAVLKKIKPQLPRFALKDRRGLEVAGHPAVAVTCQWRQSSIDLAQLLVFFELDVDAPAPLRRVMTFTMTAPLSAETEARGRLVAMLESLKIRRI